MDFWEWADAHGVGITAVATVALVLATVATLWFAGRDSARRNRPMVSANFARSRHGGGIVFRLTNYGPTRAVDVHVTFSPELENDEKNDLIQSRYRNPIPVLNPGEVYENSWFIPRHENNAVAGNHFALPDKVTVTASYKRFWWFRYVDVTPLDINTYLHSDELVSSDSELGSLRSMAGSLKKISTK